MTNIVYTIPHCPFCTRVKILLDGLGVEYEERLIEDRARMNRLKDEYLFFTFPMVILRGKFVGGFRETRELVDSGKLDELLG